MERYKVDESRINIIITPDLKYKLKTIATAEKKTITQIVIKLIEKYVKK